MNGQLFSKSSTITSTMHSSCSHRQLHVARGCVANSNASRLRVPACRQPPQRSDPRSSPAFRASAQRRGVQLHAVEVAQPVRTPNTDANEREIRDGVHEGQLLQTGRLSLRLSLPHCIALDPCINEGATPDTTVDVGFWQWTHNGNSYRIRYQRSGLEGPHAVLVHGFGGNW